MIAGDIPQAHRSPEAMARCLVTYIDDPRKVRVEVWASFGNAPCVTTIRRMRERHLRGRAPKSREVFKAHEGYRPTDASDAAFAASERFLERLRYAHPERFAA